MILLLVEHTLPLPFIAITTHEDMMKRLLGIILLLLVSVPSSAAPPFFYSNSDRIYFSPAAAVTRYVNAATGSDVTCDGKGSGPSSGGIPCAWASVQHALDDIPNGWTNNVDILVAAGTDAANQTWAPRRRS